MAKENIAILYGYVEKKKQEVLESGRNCGLSLQIKTLRLNKKGIERYDTPILLTQNPEIIVDCLDINPGDMVSVKGTLRSIQHENGSSEIVINILWIHRMEENIDITTANSLLHKNAEVSNNVFLFGTVCKKTNYYCEEGKTTRLCFKIASNRRRYVVGDTKRNRTDYFWVKCFGKIADQAFDAIDLNSEIYLSGYLQTRIVSKKEKDLETGEMITKIKQYEEIVPYSIEYVKNCKTKKDELGIAEKYNLMEERVMILEEKQKELNQSEFFIRHLCTCLLNNDGLM